MSTIFTQIINGTIPCYKVKEDDHFIAFLDIQPLVIGHTLVVPKLAVDKWYHLPNPVLQGILTFAQPIATAIELSFACERCGISIIGLEVPHTHLHLVPISTANDLNFTQAKLSLTPQQMVRAQELILGNLS